ncbi:MAG: acetyltransferase [Marinospirillum sp.]|uniref:acetyltransferase n=1 Tax=Marinospirillum sp. TaxID=2183934 RepID=UPI0019F3215F|nr:acetyltransferase [Marinospirillum sp.]MBE0509045.1 acetyltransferase [Marinospirillum sp.]
MTRQVILLGAGGHAKVVLDVLQLLNQTVVGVTDPQLHQQGIAEWRGLPVLGDDQAVTCYQPDQIFLANGLGSLPGQTLRQTIYKQFKNLGYSFITLVHPSALIGTGVTFAEGVQIMAGSILQPDTYIGENTLINTGAQLDHDCSIGKHCHLAPGVILCGNVTMEDTCHLGPASCVTQGCHLGQGSILGAGSTLLKNLPAGGKLLAAKPQSPVTRSSL